MKCSSGSTSTTSLSSAPSVSIRRAKSARHDASNRSLKPVTITNDLPNLYDFGPSALDRELAPLVAPPFRIKQVREWMHVRGVESFDAMSNLPKDLRTQLASHYTLAFPEIVDVTEPGGDGSRKYLFALRDGNRIEAVYMPMGERTSVCLSSQAGCAVG